MHHRTRAELDGLLEYAVDADVQPFLAMLGSPIEQALFEAFFALHYCFGYGAPAVNGKRHRKGTWLFTINPQEKIGDYRVDFVLVCDKGKKVVVECDGHDFHERTKEQAAKDRKRDRELQAKGYLVLRYTGSEIYRSPTECAMDAIKKLLGLPTKESKS